MSIKRKGLRYSQKRLDYKREEGTALRLKLMRSVLAVGVGFALSPWLAREAMAEAPVGNIVRTGTSTNLIASGKADIYAEKAANGVGLNAFEHFTVGNNQIANMYFRTQNDPTALNTLVNTVQNRIDIYGTVNAIRNSKIGGNLYFLSPEGMIVGSSGVINAGSLTVMTSAKTFSSAEAAARVLADKSWGSLDSEASIDIHGQINTATGIDLRAAYINITKAQGESTAPILKTGVMFAEAVNTTEISQQAGNIVAGQRLTATADDKGNIIIADPSNEAGATGEDLVKGDGSIKIVANAKSNNTSSNFLNLGLTDTVEAKVEVGTGAQIDAVGNVAITAEAVRENTTLDTFYDMLAYTKADVSVDGFVTGADITISADAKSTYSMQNAANLLNILSKGVGDATGGYTVNSKMTGWAWDSMWENGLVGPVTGAVSNILNQVYMPFGVTSAKATTTIGKNAVIKANMLKNGQNPLSFYDREAKKTIYFGGNVDIKAQSSAKNTMKVGVQRQYAKKSQDKPGYAAVAFGYEDSVSNAHVDVLGTIEAERDVSIDAIAKNSNKLKLAVKKPAFKDSTQPPGSGTSSGVGMLMASISVVMQDTDATVNLGSATSSSKAADGTARIKAGGEISVNAKTVNTISAEASAETTDETVLSTAINVISSTGDATVNDYVAIEGDAVNIGAEHETEELSVYTDNCFNGEYTGLDWILDQDETKEMAQHLGELVGYLDAANNQPGGNNVKLAPDGWNNYFDVGASIAVVNVTNNAKTNLKPTSSVKAYGDIDISSNVAIDDTSIIINNILVNNSPKTNVGVSAAVGVENMHNTAETNIESDSTNKVRIESENGKVAIKAETEQAYNRVDTLIEDFNAAVKKFKEQFSGDIDPIIQDKLDRLQNIIYDIKTLSEENKGKNWQHDDKFGKKVNACIDIVNQFFGTTDIYNAIWAFADAANYTNMYVAAANKKEDEKVPNDMTAMATGSVGVQNLHNTANVNIAANTEIKAGEYKGVDITAAVKESNVLGVGKWTFLPDVITTSGAKNGLGGSVAVQNAYNNSKVQIMNGVKIDAGSVDIATKNDVLNLGIVLGGAQTSQRGLTGMVSFMGGDSHAETLVDDDVSFTARKKLERVTEKDKDVEVDKVTSNGAVNISANNDTNVISIVGDIMSTGGSAIGVSTGVISYDINSLAKVENQENTDTSGKGLMTANSVNVSALTDGVINNITVAGNKNGTSNSNAQAGGVQANAAGGAGAANPQGGGGVQAQAINANNGNEDVAVRINAAGSVSWNYVVDETRATLDNVNIVLTEPDIAADVTDAKLKNDVTTAVNVKAEDSSYIGAYSGAAALSKLGNNSHASFQAALSGAVAVNDLKKETYSTFKNSSVENADNIYNLAQNSGAQVAAGLSLGIDTGTRQDGVSVDLGASGSANYINSTVHADMLSDTMQGKSGGAMSVNNVAYDKDVQVAGGVTIEYAKSSVALGAAVTVNSITNNIQANMSNMNIGSMGRLSANVENLALSKLTQVGTAVSVGVLTGNGKNYAVGEVAVANNTVHNTVKATISGGTIYAQTVASEARDGKLKENEADNKYLAEINAVPNSIDVNSEGNYIKDGEVLRYDEATGKYYDSNNKEVDVNASEDGHIFDLDGSDTQQFLRDADIGVNSNSDGSLNESGKYSHQSISVTNQGNTIVGVALGLGIKTGDGGTPSGAGAVAVNVNNVDNTFAAAIENNANIIAGPSVTTTGSDGKTTTTLAVQVNALSDTKIVGVAAGVAANVSGGNNVNIGAAGSAVKQSIKNDTTATVADSTINTDNLSLDAETTSTLVSVAGQVSVATGENSIAAGLTWAENHLDNTTGVYAKGITLSGINSGVATNLVMSAENKSKTWAVAAGGSVSTGRAAAEGAYASNNGTNDTEAIVDKYETKNEQGVVTYTRNSTINNAKNISVTAKDNTVEKGIAGSIAVAAGKDTVASIGGAVVYNNIGNSATDKQTVKAQVHNAAITTVSGSTMQVKAINDADFLGLALGGAVRASTEGTSPIGISAQGSVAVSTAYMDTMAGLKNVKVYETSASQNSKVEVEANSTSDITSSADALFVSAGKGGAQIAVGAVVSKVYSDADTETEIKNSIIKAQDVIAKANSTNKILDVAIGVGVGAGAGPATASVAGNIAVNKIDNDTTVTFENDDIYATGTVAALSDSYEQLRNYGGGISVAATSGQAAVALGATVVTNTIEGDTKSVVNNSSITALGAGDGVKVNKHSFDAITGSSSKYELKEQAAKDTTAKKGLVVNAEADHFLRDVSITGGVSVSTQVGVAVDATVVINKIAGTTSAEVNSTDVNKNAAQVSTADVTVDAYDRADISSHIGTMSVGVALGEGAGVGAAGAGDRNTVNRTTTARILGKADGSTTLNAHNVNVDALGYTSVYLSESGLAAGASALAGAGVTGSVSVDRFTSNTTALVSQVKGTVNDLIVKADRLANVEAYNNAITLSGGIFSGSVSVGVTDVEDTSHTNAELSKVQVAGANNQSGKVRVLAENHTQLGTELSGDALAVSIGGAAGIAVGNINTEAQVGAKVDHAVIGTEAKEFGEFTVEANNYTYNRYQNIAVGAGSLLGVAVGKGAMNINTGTAAEVLNSSAFAKNINVNAFERRTIDTDMVGVGVGALVVGVNVMYTNIGTNMQSKYTYDDGSKEYDNSDFATMVNNALARMNSQVDVVRTKTGDNSIEYSSSTINTGRAAQGGIRNTISNSALKASEDLKVQAKATTNTDIDIKQASIAIVNIGVPANRTDVEDKLTIDIDNAALHGKTITVDSTTDGEIKSYTGQGGFSAGSYVDTTVYIKHHGTNTITIDGSTLRAVNAASTTVNPLSIHALNQTKINNSAFGLNYGGLVAGRVVLEGEDSTEVKIELGKNANVNKVNSFSASKIVNNKTVNADISVLAENRPLVKDEINSGVSVGGVAAGGSLVVSKASGKAILDVSNKNSFKGQNVALEANTSSQKKWDSATEKYIDEYTVEAINHAVGVTALSINVDKARTFSNMEASTTVGAISIEDGAADVKIGATNATKSNAYIHSVRVGLGAACGSNFAQSHAEGKAITTVNAGAAGISANSFDIFASNSDDIVAKADGSNAGLMNISPYAARVENTVDTTTTVNLTGKFTAVGAFKAQALRKDVANFAADALSVTAAGGGDARADSTITANTNLNVTEATITSGSDMLLEAENTVELNREDGYAEMVKGQGYAIIGINTSGIANTINSTAHVNLLNSNFTSGGNLKVIAHTEEQLQVNGYVYTASAYGGVKSVVTNTITNDELVKVENSELETTNVYKDITLSAADDLKLFTYAYSEFSSGAMGGADAIVNNKLTRNNKINLLSGSDLYSLQDINLYAGKNADGSVATLDLDAEATDFVGSEIPITIKPSLNNDIKQNNQITVDAASTSTSVRHTNLYASTGREMARLSSGRYVGIWSSKRDSKFVTTDKGETVDGKTANNYVDINGKVVAGIANKIDITIGNTGDIVILDEALRNSVSGAKDASQITINVNANESTGLTRDSLTFGSENYANTLYERYNGVLDVMNEYEKDGTNSAVYLGYQAEATRILEEMLSLGLAERVPVKDFDPQNPTYVLEPKASLLVDYVEIPELVGSGGNITVDTDVFKSSGGTGVTKAQGTPVINITNNTNLMTKVNSIIVGDPGGKLVYNGINVSGTNTEAFNQSIKALNKGNAEAGFDTVEAADGESGVINIHGKYNGKPLNYSFIEAGKSYTGQFRPMANIQIQGNIYSKEGTVTIKSDNDSILMQGVGVKDAVSVSGSTINIIAENGNITQGYTDGIVNIGADVRRQYDAQYQQIIKKTDGTYTLSYVETPIDDNSKGSGSYIAGGSVYINASDININGVIQSGFGDYYADISDTTVQARITQINNAYTGRAISDSVVTSGEQYKIIDGGAYWSAAEGCYKYRLNVYYNPSTKKILVQNVDASGGKIYLTGRISSTGNGKIVCLDGVSNITVNNTTSYDLQVGDLITHDVAGVVSITDTAKGKLTEITNGKVTVKDILAGGKISSTGTSSDFTGSYDYAPQMGLRYTWTTGKEVTTFSRYSKDFKEGGWGMWNNGVSTEQLARWTVENHVQPDETGLTNNKDRAPGETIRLDTTAANNSFVTVTHKKVTDKTVKESERKSSTGLWGINKHYVVTWTRTTGDLYTYDASVKADNPINIKFVGNNADSGNVNVTSINNIELTGSVGNTALYETKVNDVVTGRNEKGTVNITSQKGSLIQSGGALYGANINLSAAKDITDITVIAGDTVNLSAVNNMSNQDAIAQNSIDVTVKGAYLAKGNVVLGNIGSVVANNNVNSVPVNASGVKTTGVTGLVEITTTGPEGNIYQKAGSLIVSDRIDLTSNNGSIYGQKSEDANHNVTYSALQLYAGQQPIGLDTLDASVNASAKGNINLEQVDGNMRIGRIYSTEGDVTLTVAHGSVEDALPYVSSDRGDADDMLARWKRMGIIASDSEDAENSAMLAAKAHQNATSQQVTQNTYEAWDAYALLYAIQDSIVNPEASALPSTSDKDPNVIGHNITINVADSVGMNSGVEKRIDTATLLDKDASGNYKNLDDLKSLSKLDASTKVTWEIGENGHTHAVYTETIPIGIQQTTKIVTTGQETTVVKGKLTIQSAATSDASSNALHGGIFLQGREQKLANGEGTPITQNKDLFVNNILTNVGEVTLTSLGGIYNAASNNLPAITGQNLVITAAGGSIGTEAVHLTTKLLGEDKTTDGLSAIATGGIYVDQKGYNPLLVSNVSSGGDIYLGSDQSIFMGVVNGTDAVNYIRAENNGDIVLEARGGSIGEPEYEKDAQGNYVLDANGNKIIYRGTNKGVRILNSASASSSANDTNASNVVLCAHDNVYVTGVASVDGKTAVVQGPAGVLNLTVEGVSANGQAVTLKNVGVYVDGGLNLESAVSASETATIYITDNFTLNNNITITSPDTYLGSAKNLTVENIGNIIGQYKLTLEAVDNLTVNDGALNSKKLLLRAGDDVFLNAGSLTAFESLSIYAGQVLHAGADLSKAGTKIIVHNDENSASALLSAGNKLLLTKGSLTADVAKLVAYTTQANGSANIVESTNGYILKASELTLDGKGISLDSKENQLQNVIVDKNSSGAILIGSGNTTAADLLVSLGDASSASDKLNGSLTVHNYDNGTNVVNKLVVNQLLAATGNIELINDETDINIANGAAITANNVLLQAENDTVKLNGGTITAFAKSGGLSEKNGSVALVGKNVIMSAGAASTVGASITAVEASITAKDSIALNTGSLTANKAALTADEGSINEAKQGFTVDVADLNAVAKNTIALDSTANQLEKVTVSNSNGNVAIGSGNNQNGNALTILTDNGKVNGNLLIVNYKDGSAYQNIIAFANKLEASGNITVINEEADINVEKEASIKGKNIELTAGTGNSFYNINVKGGNVTAAETINLVGNNVTTTGTLKGRSVGLNADGFAAVNGGNTTGNNVNLTSKGDTYLNGGSIIVTNNGNGELVINSSNIIEQSGGVITADKANLSAEQAVNLKGGSITVTNNGNGELSINSSNIIEQSGGVITADKASMSAQQAVKLNSGSITVTNNGNGELSINSSNIIEQSGGVITADKASMSAQQAVKLNGGSITVTNNGNGELAINSGNIVEQSGSAITADKVSMSAQQAVKLNGGSLVAKEASLFVLNSDGTESIVEKFTGYRLDVDKLSASANKGDIKLDSTNNRLVDVIVHNYAGNISIGSANAKDAQALSVTTSSEVVNGAISIVNYSDGSDKLNKIAVVDKLQASGAISIINKETDIALAQGAIIKSVNDSIKLESAKNITLEGLLSAEQNVSIVAEKAVTVAGSITANSNATLKAGTDIIVRNNASVVAQEEADFIAGGDFVHKGGNIKANNKVYLETDGNILLEGGFMSSANVDMLALGYIDETYNNNVENANGYLLNVSNTLEVLTSGKNMADGNDYGIDLGSRFNQLHKVIMDSDNGNIVLGNGGSQDLEIEVQSGQEVQGSIVIHNYVGGDVNDIKVVNNLKARDNIDIINDEQCIIVNSGVLQAQGNIVINAYNGDVMNFAAITSLNGNVDIFAADNVYNIGDAATDVIMAKGTVSIVAGTTNKVDSGLIWNTTKIHADENVVIEATNRIINLVNGDSLDIPDDVSSAASNQSGSISALGTVKIFTTEKHESENDSFGIYNSASITAGEAAIINSRGRLTNTGDIIAGSYVDLDATESVINGNDDRTDNVGNIAAKGNVYITSWKGDVNNFDNIKSETANVVLENGYVYTLEDNDNTSLVNNINNTGSILAQQDVLIRTYNGNIENKNIITSSAGSVTIEALQSEQYTDSILVGALKNTDTDTATSNADITAAQNITLNAATSVENKGDFVVTGTGNIVVTATGVINTVNGEQVTAGGDILNYGNYYTKNGNITMQSNEDVLNRGVMETESGDIDIISVDGVVFNREGADLLSGNGNVSLRAQSNDGYFYYFDANDELQKVPDGATTSPAGDGTYTAVIDGASRTVLKNGSVFNAGDAMAINGTITMSSAHGDVTNYDNFNTLKDQNGKEAGTYSNVNNPHGIAISTGNIVLSSEHGTLFNSKDLESGENVTLIAARGLTNFAYNIYAGKDITLTATEGDVVNSATLESYAGNVLLVAEKGSIINGVQNDLTEGKGDIITYGGDVTLWAKGYQNGVGTNVTNYGDIIATNTNAIDKDRSGSIILKSEHGNVDNFDDFNTYNVDGVYYKDYNADLHTSIDSNNSSYNIANNNLTISAKEGRVYNSKGYLVALGNVDLEAKTGLSSFGQAIYAGKNITMTATDGDLFNQAELLSVEGDISLKAEQGTVVNLIGGDIIARNGNVVLEAGAEAEKTIKVVDAIGNAYALSAEQGQSAGDNIVITRQYYKDANGVWIELAKTERGEVVAPENASEFKTAIYYLDGNKKDAEKLVTEVEGNKSSGLLEAYRNSDVVNRGDIVAQGNFDENKGAVTLHSYNGNTTNYDNFKLYNGKDSYDYFGKSGSEHQSLVDGAIQTIKVKFNPNTSYYQDELGILISDSDMNLLADKGYLYNNMNIISERDVNLASGKNMTIGTNVASIIAKGDVTVRSNYGSVINDGHVESKENSIVLDAQKGVESKVGAANLKALNGSISAVTTYGEIYIDELVAGEMAAAGSRDTANIKIGKVSGKDIVLYSESANSEITVNNISVDEHLLLQGNSFNHIDENSGEFVAGLGKIDRVNLDGTLVVDVNGVGQSGTGSAMKGDLTMEIAGDVRFTTMNVTNANVVISGKLSIDKLHTNGAAHLTSQGFVTGVYGGGTTPYHDSSNALYYDLGDGSGNGSNLRVTADEFRAIKETPAEGAPATIRALTSMRKLRERLVASAQSPETFNKDNAGWMNLYVDTPRYQRSNGLLLHIDTGYRSANQRWSAEDLSAKLLDYKPAESFAAHYGDDTISFGRYNLVAVTGEVAVQPLGVILQSESKQSVVLRNVNGKLQLEQEDEDNHKQKDS